MREAEPVAGLAAENCTISFCTQIANVRQKKNRSRGGRVKIECLIQIIII